MSFGLSRGKKLDVGAVGINRDDLPSFDPTGVERLDPRQWYPDPARPFDLEIGSGKGTFLVQQAELEPTTNFLGIEWTGEFYRYAADRIRRRQLTNVKVLWHDATEFITWWVPDASIRVLHLYFSDPWPKARHHKRRVVQDVTLAQFHRVLVAEGELRLVTDHDDLWAWYEEHATRNAHLFDRIAFERPASAGEGEVVGTNFERKYKREGRPFHAMTLRKR